MREQKNIENQDQQKPTDYTKEELDEFRELVELGESAHQMDRIVSRREMPKFVKRVGKQKCDEMFKVLTAEFIFDWKEKYAKGQS